MPAELPKAPFRPQVAGRIAFFFGPIAGAFVSAINLRRMGHSQKAKRVTLITLFVSVVVATALLITIDVPGRLIGLGLEIAFYFVFTLIQNREFDEWQAAHEDVAPSNGWMAVGWGVMGLLLFMGIAVIVTLILNAVGSS